MRHPGRQTAWRLPTDAEESKEIDQALHKRKAERRFDDHGRFCSQRAGGSPPRGHKDSTTSVALAADAARGVTSTVAVTAHRPWTLDCSLPVRSNEQAAAVGQRCR